MPHALKIGLLLLLGLPLVALGSTMKWALGASTNLLDAQLNSLANNNYTAVGTIYNNKVGGGGGDGAAFCDIEGVFTFGANPSPGTAIVVWLLTTTDDTNFENTPTATVLLGRTPNVVLPVTSGQTGTRVNRQVNCPWGNFRAVAKNDGTGQSLAASGNVVRIRPATIQFTTP